MIFLILEKYHLLLKEALARNEIETILQICGECQTTAISLGNMLEESFPDSHRLIPILEKYYEKYKQNLNL